MGKKRMTHDAFMNMLTYRVIYEGLKLIALSMFEWENLPKGMKPEYIERALFENGQALFFMDRKLGHLCLPCYSDGYPNPYGEYTRFRATGNNYSEVYSIAPDDKQAVRIINNRLETPTHDIIEYYTQKLVNVERSIDSNVSIQKFPFIIKCDDKSKLTFQNIFDQVQSNAPVIYADKNMNLDNIDVLDTNAPMVIPQLTDYRHDLTNEALTRLGVNNANTDKKERLVTDEVNANNDFIRLNADSMFETRERAVKEINEMFGLNISVKIKREEVQDGEVHDGAKGDSGE